MSLLEIKGLVKEFGGIKALGGVDFHIDEGEIINVDSRTGDFPTTSSPTKTSTRRGWRSSSATAV